VSADKVRAFAIGELLETPAELGSLELPKAVANNESYGRLARELAWGLAGSPRLYPNVSGRALERDGHAGDVADLWRAVECHRLAFAVLRLVLYVLDLDADARTLGAKADVRAKLVAAFPPLGAQADITARDLHEHVHARLSAGFQWAKRDAKERGAVVAASVRASGPVLLRVVKPPPRRGGGGGGAAAALTTEDEDEALAGAAWVADSDDE
jgi:hypothetical protein